ncbi:MAG: hypothetical protein ABSG43_22865, partial [Solirubrobacteraceae bacterium]
MYSRFLSYGMQRAGPEDFALVPSSYFENRILADGEWRGFLDLVTSTPDELRQASEGEAAEYGETLYRSHSFDKTPLIDLSDGRIVPAGFAG